MSSSRPCIRFSPLNRDTDRSSYAQPSLPHLVNRSRSLSISSTHHVDLMTLESGVLKRHSRDSKSSLPKRISSVMGFGWTLWWLFMILDWRLDRTEAHETSNNWDADLSLKLSRGYSSSPASGRRRVITILVSLFGSFSSPLLVLDSQDSPLPPLCTAVRGHEA